MLPALPRDVYKRQMYGSFPKVLREYVRERRVLTLEQAVAKMTSLPARRMNLTDRGILAPGAFADVLIFDPARFRDRATFAEPTRLAEGLDWVFLNGTPVWRDGSLLCGSAERCIVFSQDGK